MATIISNAALRASRDLACDNVRDDNVHDKNMRDEDNACVSQLIVTGCADFPT